MNVVVALLLCSILLFPPATRAQAPYVTEMLPARVAEDIPANRGAAALWQSLKKLNTRASMMMIVAHPDDEDGATLAYESRARGARVSLLQLNRGEGGANVMSRDFFDALGLVRTMELLKAGQYYGVEQNWTRLIDYGFSKTLDESLKKWTRDKILYDVVRVVRERRPLVITSVFVGGPSDGHGNHQAAGLMAREVVRAAGDPNVFPDQIRAGLRPWSPRKGYARVPFRRRPADASSPTHVSIPTGEYDPLLGSSYLQIAREGLGFQKSQVGGGSIPKLGESQSQYTRFHSSAPAAEQEASFYDGIDTTLLGLAELAGPTPPAFLRQSLERIAAHIQTATARFSAIHPEQSAPALAEAMKAILSLLAEVRNSALPASAQADLLHELEIKRVQCNNALAQSLGLAVYANLAPEQELSPMMAQFLGDAETQRVVIPGQAIAVKARAVSTTASPVTLENLRLEPSDPSVPWNIPAAPREQLKLAPNQPVDFTFSTQVPANAPLTRPYFDRPDIEQPFYNIRDPRYFSASLPPYPLAVWADFRAFGVPIRLGKTVQTMKRLAGWGAVYEPLLIGPAMSVSLTPRAGVVPLSSTSFTVKATVLSNVRGKAQAMVRLALPPGWKSEPERAPLETRSEGEKRTLNFVVTPAALASQAYELSAVVDYAGQEFREGYEVAGYPGLLPYHLYRPATYRTSGVDVKIADHLKVGYIMGTGDEVPESLTHLGIEVMFLAPADVASANLSDYDMILLGVRTFAAREELKTFNSRLLEYVKAGGVLMVQYNTPEYNNSYGPYAYDMSQSPEEVTDEASEVRILNPQHPVFNWPNRITPQDFSGWVEERGSKWMKTWDPQYEALLETHDEGQPEQKGGLLYARYGKGIYIYNAYAFYRQLPEGVPGAYRIFANLLSLPKNPRLR